MAESVGFQTLTLNPPDQPGQLSIGDMHVGRLFRFMYPHLSLVRGGIMVQTSPIRYDPDVGRYFEAVRVNGRNPIGARKCYLGDCGLEPYKSGWNTNYLEEVELPDV